MAVPSDLAQFLSSSKKNFLENPTECSVVMGNEAGDLDSLASSIAYAWFNSNIHGHPTVPLIQIEHEDLILRPENIHALQAAGIHHPRDQLLCLTDVAHLKPFPTRSFMLVDHNRLGQAFTSNAPVTAVIDHHEDEGLYKDSAEPRVIEPAGSCASLITRHFRESDHQLPPELAILLLSAIIIDTAGLVPKGKAVGADRQAAAYLLGRCRLLAEPAGTTLVAAPNFSIEESNVSNVPAVKDLTSRLSALKEDISSLGVRHLLRRDYKEYNFTFEHHRLKVGLATVPLPLKAWAKRKEMSDETVNFMKDRQLTILGILTSFRSEKQKKHKRQMLWVFLNDDSLEDDLLHKATGRLLTGLESSKELDVRDHKTFSLDSKVVQWKAYKQGNAKATRKAVAPLVKSLLDFPE